MENWKVTITAGNQAFRDGADAKAEAHYQRACQIAQSLLIDTDQFETKLAALAISYQNLADLYQRQHRLDLALEQFQQLTEHLLAYQAQHVEDREKQTQLNCVFRSVGLDLSVVINEQNLQCTKSKRLIKSLQLAPILIQS